MRSRRRRSAPVTGHPYLDRATDGRVLAFAHRGGAEHPDLVDLENTAFAFAHAVALGYDYLETDVHVTRDGVLLAFHDEILDRVTDHGGEVGRLDWSTVARAQVGGRESVPRLAELFESFPDARFNIDIKSAAAAPVLAAFIEEHAAWDRVLVGSFSARRLNTFRRLTRGRVPTSAHPGEVVAFRLLPSGRLADWLTRGRVSCLQVPHWRGSFRVTTPGLVTRAHAAGKHVHVWTVDDPDEMAVLIDRGVDGLMTDRTDILKDVLVARGLWRGTP